MRAASIFAMVSAAAGTPPPPAPIIGGQGDFRYQYMPDKLQMPHVSQNSHGLAIDADKNIYLTYDPIKPDTNCLVRWKPDGTDPELLGGGGSALCAGTPHGLHLAVEGKESFLYHANNAQVLHKTKLDGTIVWTIHNQPDSNTDYLPYRPTWFAAPPGSKYIYMSDGYGSQFIHVYTTDGKYTGHSFGGRGKTDGKFETCHSINYDPRMDKLIVSDRENHRHQYFDFDKNDASVFKFSGKFNNTPGIQRPCTIRTENGNGFSVIADLVGPVGILDKNNKLVSSVNVAGLLAQWQHKHPHDAIFLPNGDLVVCTWNPGRISYWKKLPPQ